MKDVIIIGTGGHAKVVADIVLSARDHLVGFLTSDDSIDNFIGRPVLGLDTEYDKFIDGISICQDCMIGAGAVAIKNIDISGMYVGIPTHRIK